MDHSRPPGWDRPPDAKSGNPFDWTTPHKSDAAFITPAVDGREHQVMKITGAWNNIDVYLQTGSGFWFLPLLAPTLRLYAMVSGGPVLVEEVDLSTLPPATTATGRIRALRARGRPTDGWQVTVTITPGIDLGKMPVAQLVAYNWGTETADTVEAIVVPGPDPLPVVIVGQPIEVEATIVAPDPLVVTPDGGGFNVREIPAGNWVDQTGTAPDGSGGATVATALAAGVAERYVAVSSAKANAAGTILYVKATAGNLASASGYELGPGDTAEIPIVNANLIFVLGSAAGVAYRVAVV